MGRRASGLSSAKARVGGCVISGLAIAWMSACTPLALDPFGRPYSTQRLMTAGPLKACRLPDGASPPMLEFGSLPVYPQGNLRSGMAESVLVHYVVTDDGAVKPQVPTSDHGNYFVVHAVIAMRDWRVRPATVNGAPITVACRFRFNYQIAQ